MRLNIERQNKLEPSRMESTKAALEELGYCVFTVGKSLVFCFRGHDVTFWPYSGWHSGASIKDGRGFNKLIKQIKP